MTKILQIRRGTTAQNDEFTGMPGELTFDTDTKILRVHDGKTLGGILLARRDQTSESNPTEQNQFDINSVPDEFWQNIVNRFKGEQINIDVSDSVPLGNIATVIQYNHHSQTPVKFATVQLVCQKNDAGYTSGNVVGEFGIGARTNPLPNIANALDNPNESYLQLNVGGETFWVLHNLTGVKTSINKDCWNIQFTIWH